MLISVFKSKIHMATITSTLLHYEGSIAIDPVLLKAAGLIPGEKVHVLNFDNGNRLETYTIVGEKGEISLRGPAAKMGKKGQKVIILAYGLEDQKKAGKIRPKIVHVDGRNKIK
ncbi:MAG: aspartate 1-decarboxylase [Candidatus Margulisbacteria bacterium]|jgi:aspartate 1-decarboxylase|nr:aspartate 1-decarboxylase [Candidatus Margulisiibacteriota bacterium]